MSKMNSLPFQFIKTAVLKFVSLALQVSEMILHFQTPQGELFEIFMSSGSCIVLKSIQDICVHDTLLQNI